jgi:hypothetical protein
VQFQAELRQPFLELFKEPHGIGPLLEAHHKSSRPGELHPQAHTDSGLERLRSSGSYRPVAA